MAGEFFLLEMDNVVLASKSGDNTIALKRELRDQYPGERFRDAKLMSVMVVAKSRGGRGTMRLMVGPTLSAAQGLGGSRPLWASEDQSTFDRILFEGPTNQNRGRWQLHTTGRVKVHQIMVEVDKNSTQRVVLDYAGMHTQTNKGGVDRLALKRKMRDMGMEPNDFELVAASLVAKSRRGRATAVLRVGGDFAAQQTIAGQPSTFQSPGQFNTLRFTNPSNTSDGRWQILLNGNIKIKQVVLELKAK